MKTLLMAINSKYIHTAMGMHSVYNYCLNKNQEIALCEESTQTPILSTLAKISIYKADIVGINVHIWNKNYVFELITLMKKVMPQVIIVLGGPEVSFNAAEILKLKPEADYIVQGEGEIVFNTLLNCIKNGNNKVPEFVAYRNPSREIYAAEKVAVVEDLAELPFPYENIAEIVKEFKIPYYECTRGCPFSCSYCLSGISRNVRRRPLAIVLEHLSRFIKADVPLVKFVDRTYNLDEEYFLPIMQYLAGAETNTTFHFEIKADLLSAKVLAFLKTVPKGRFQFEVGVQTTNLETLQAIGRQDNWDSLSKNVKQLHAFGNIHMHLDLIAGLPYEGMESFRKSFNDVYSLQPEMLQLGFLKVLQGALINQQREEHGLIYMNEPPYEILQTKYLNYNNIRFLKILEDVFDLVYNTGKFKFILKALIEEKYAGDSFNFFAELAKWWEAKDLWGRGHNIKNVTLLLMDFIEDKHDDSVTRFKEILKFDVFVGQPNYKPDIFNWKAEALKEKTLNFWRQEAVYKYLPEYDFSTWRKLRKYFPIEEFNYNPITGSEGQIIVLADYTRGENRYMIINEEDFDNESI